MVLAELAGMDERQAAGFLARASLALMSSDNPAATPSFYGEEEKRAQLIARLKTKAREIIASDDEETINELVADWIDEEIELPSDDQGRAFARLSERGVLPGDAYKVVLNLDFQRRMGKLGIDDAGRVVSTVKHPTLETHFNADSVPPFGGNASIFGKWFGAENGIDPYFLIVCGHREADVLRADHWWRLYPQDVVFMHLTDMGDALERFAQVYGRVFRLGDWEGKFLRSKSVVAEGGLSVQVPQLPGQAIFTAAIAVNGTRAEIAFGVGVDIGAYAKAVLKHLKRDEIRSKSKTPTHSKVASHA